jgi:hypothetical protein
MKAKDLTVPIVNRLAAVRNHPFELLDEAFRQNWVALLKEMATHAYLPGTHVLRMFECYLQISGQSPPSTFDAATFPTWDRLFKQLLAAIASPHFYLASVVTRNRAIWLLQEIRRALAIQLGTPLTWHINASDTADVQIERLISLFEDQELDEDRVVVWQGWPCKTKSKRFIFAPLLPVHTFLGGEFTEKLYRITATYVGGRQNSTPHGVIAFSKFLASQEFPVNLEMLQDPEQTSEFFFQLYDHYVRTSYDDGNGLPVSKIVNCWRGAITTFFRDHVFPSGLIAKPNGAFPTPRGVSIVGEPTNIRLIGTEETHVKLLTPIPIQISDDDALELIFTKVKEDLNLARTWAWTEVQRMARLLERRKQLAQVGRVRMANGVNNSVEASTAWDHPNCLENGAATFEHHGYPCRSDMSSVLFPTPVLRWATELAVPVTGALIPHCAVLVGEHPKLTPSFLENLELYDKHGKLRAIVPTDTGEILSGTKLRRGPALAEQEISLNARSSFALNQIVMLTQPLRDYLRKRNDDKWRYLLLASGKGLAYPNRVKLSSDTSSSYGLKRLTDSAASALGLDENTAFLFAKRFSLSALRASAAVVVYFETKDSGQMAKALGHAKYDPGLLDRYLPKVIRDFFQERWVRIFQAGIIVQALQGSKYLLRASGFSNMTEVHEFLSNHALQLPSKRITKNKSNEVDPWAEGDVPSPREIVFALNEEILTLLLSLAKVALEPKHPMNSRAMYWADMANTLIPYIRSSANARDDIRFFLDQAEKNASIDLVDGIAYA